jgi:hypothetical protein
MGHTADTDIKTLAFRVLERTRLVPRTLPVESCDGTPGKATNDAGSRSRKTHVLSQEQADYRKRFGCSHAILFPLIGKRVLTPRGLGRLETVYAARCEVILESDPEKIVVFSPTQIGLSI